MASYYENPKKGEFVAIGSYSETLEITFSTHSVCTSLGPKRIVTKPKWKTLYEIDGQPALESYKTYLGNKAKDLPSTALWYPLNVTSYKKKQSIVRFILNINE